MAAEWNIKGGEKVMARKVSDRTYETLDDLAEEVQAGGYEYDTPLMILAELRRRLQATLPFDPEEA